MIFSRENIPAIATALKNENVVIMPTDTIPGFTADVRSKTAMENIQKYKGRDQKKPFLLLASDFFMAEKLVDFCPLSRHFFNALSTPVTFVLPRKPNILPHFFPHFSSLAIRIPRNKNLQKLIHLVGRPLVSTSVNTSGEKAMQDFLEMERRFSESCVIVKGEPTTNISSTILSFFNGKVTLLREGNLSSKERAAIEASFTSDRVLLKDQNPSFFLSR